MSGLRKQKSSVTVSEPKRNQKQSPVESIEGIQFMDLPDDIHREIFKKTKDKNLLLVNKSLTKTIEQDADLALVRLWLSKPRWKDDHESEVQFRNMLRRGLDPNTVFRMQHPRTKDILHMPMITLLCSHYPLLAKILLRHPGLNPNAYFVMNERHLGIPEVFFFALPEKRGLYHDDIEYMLQTFPEKTMRNTFKFITLRFVVNTMHLKINVLDTILQRGYFSLEDIKQNIQELESTLSGEPKDSATYIYLNDALMSLIYFRDLQTSKGGVKMTSVKKSRKAPSAMAMKKQ